MAMMMSKEKLLAELKLLEDSQDTESVHSVADALLLQYIDDEAITAAYMALEKWYS
jgi:hypothetical protein